MMKPLFILLFSFFSLVSCDIFKPQTILVSNLTSRGYITEVTCNGYSMFLFKGTGKFDAYSDEFEMTFRPEQRREFIVPESIQPGDRLEWYIVFYHNKIDEGGVFAYPERVEVSIDSGTYFGNGDWLDLTDDTEVRSKNTVATEYLSDLLGGKEITVEIYNDTDFQANDFVIGAKYSLPISESGGLLPGEKERWENGYNSKNGRVQYLSFTVRKGAESQKVRLYQPQWFGESLRLYLRPATAVQEIDDHFTPVSPDPVLLENLF